MGKAWYGKKGRGEMGVGNDGVRAVTRALDILLAFTPSDGEMSAAELLSRVNLSRPTLYRLLYTLLDNGFLVSVGEPQKFRLGPSVARLAHVWSATLDVARVLEPVLLHIWQQTGETVALFVRQGRDRMCIAELPSAQALSFKQGVGYREPIMLGASGRAILAHSTVPKKELAGYARAGRIDLDGYLEELEDVRRRGYAVSRNELIQGAVSIAAPFFKGPLEVGGSIAVFGPGARLGEAQIESVGPLLVTHSQAASKLLSGLEHSLPGAS